MREVTLQDLSKVFRPVLDKEKKKEKKGYEVLREAIAHGHGRDKASWSRARGEKHARVHETKDGLEVKGWHLIASSTCRYPSTIAVAKPSHD